MKIETKWNCGNFTVGLGAEVDEAMRVKLEKLGMLYLGQRVSEVDKILGGFEKGADGKSKRKVGWKRGDVEYSEPLRHALSAAFSTLTLPDESKLECDVVIGKYDGPAKAEPKFAREKKKFAEKESSAAGLEAWLKSFAGYTGPTHGEDGEYAVEALAAAKTAIDKFLAENI